MWTYCYLLANDHATYIEYSLLDLDIHYGAKLPANPHMTYIFIPFQKENPSSASDYYILSCIKNLP